MFANNGPDADETEVHSVWFWDMLIFYIVLKLLVVAIYTNYTTTIVDDEGIEQMDAFVASPVGNKLILKFREVPPSQLV